MSQSLSNAPAHVESPTVSAARPEPNKRAWKPASDDMDKAAPPQQQEKGQRDNLPLPTELRLEIFKNLLGGRYVRGAPRTSAPTSANTARGASFAHTYQFQTSLFSVSKSVAKEAKDALLKNNTFIKGSYQGLQAMTNTIHTFGVPVVCEGSAAKNFEHASLSVHIETPKYWQTFQEPWQDIYIVNTIVLLEQDLARFGEAIAWYYRGKSVLHSIVTPIGRLLKGNDMPDEETVMQTTFHFGTRDGKRLPLGQQEALLVKLYKCAHASQHFAVMGACDQNLDIISLTRRLATTCAYMEAQAWDLVKDMVNLHTTVREFFNTGRFFNVHKLVRLAVRACFAFLCENPALETESDCYHLARVEVIMGDMIAYAYVSEILHDSRPEKLSNRAYMSYASRERDLQDRAEVLGIIPPRINGIYHDVESRPQVLWTRLLEQMLIASSRDFMRDIYDSFKALAQQVPEEKNICSDADVAEEWLRTATDEELECDDFRDWEQGSFCHGASRLISMLSFPQPGFKLDIKTKAAYEFEVPEGMVGIVDEKMEKRCGCQRTIGRLDD